MIGTSYTFQLNPCLSNRSLTLLVHFNWAPNLACLIFCSLDNHLVMCEGGHVSSWLELVDACFLVDKSLTSSLWMCTFLQATDITNCAASWWNLQEIASQHLLLHQQDSKHVLMSLSQRFSRLGHTWQYVADYIFTPNYFSMKYTTSSITKKPWGTTKQRP